MVDGAYVIRHERLRHLGGPAESTTEGGHCSGSKGRRGVELQLQSDRSVVASISNTSRSGCGRLTTGARATASVYTYLGCITTWDKPAGESEFYDPREWVKGKRYDSSLIA